MSERASIWDVSTYRLSSIKTVSIVLSRLQLARHGSLAGSTYKLSVFQPPKAIHDIMRVHALLGTNDAVSGVDTRKVDLIDELDSRWLIGILVAAVHL